MKKEIKKINNIFFKLLLLNIFLFSPSIGFSKGFDYLKKLIPDSSANSFKPLNFDLPSLDYQKSLKKKSNNNGNELRENELRENELIENNEKEDKSSKKSSNIKLLLGDVFTIHYVHNNGLGVAYNHFNPTIEYGIGTSPIFVLPFQDIFTISYKLNYDKLSFDFGFGAFSGYGEVHGCANVHTCYKGDDIEINDGKLIQLFSSYEILNYLDITLGINWSMFIIQDKKVSNSDYRLDARRESIIYPSLGFSIVF